MRVRNIARAAFLAGSLLLGIAVYAQSMATAWGLYVYPSAGQSSDQQSKDELQCRDWSTQMTGVDPAKPAPASSQPSTPSQQGSGEGLAAGRGALRGAATGALIGNLAGSKNASTWGWAGALSGSVRGASSRQKQNQQAQAQSKADSQAEAKQRLEQFKKAFSACMQGKKYTVN